MDLTPLLAAIGIRATRASDSRLLQGIVGCSSPVVGRLTIGLITGLDWPVLLRIARTCEQQALACLSGEASGSADRVTGS